MVCVDIKHDLAQRTVEMIEQDGFGQAVAVAADVTKEAECKGIVSTAIEKFGRLDILVNVVGVGGATGTAVEVDMVEWAKGMEINVGSMVSSLEWQVTRVHVLTEVGHDGQIRDSRNEEERWAVSGA